ncbi:DNA primase small subunit PriS [Natronobacterium gregoryi]|uniref:DNA primase small subunit PriS n=2 Tax=Natronobacterium gregoryi TaxID=44930 RepID=L0AP02_NATGS|nr:DNA primase small subunit PriS [Natronobacterium gregoryi]AFZ74815.1 DNA primase, eukaryotic-type, small subunit, putative [Natronobacterium gregoryi SP2]ELY66148.1 DNA primase small subunit [Natronobacterium gregoryi SP2]PLK19477.1 DNA primase catalytic subunit PriS [Natronobacterium gregoryi SP2]SFJ43632.1 DNA primase small subunit [Natronobacterium gregoryi]
MEERTRAYLRGRFRDYYRRTELTPPPAANEREWGYIPWTEGPDTTMVRHRSLLELGNLTDFLVRKRPRHVYFSAGRFRDPGAGSMNEKDWQSADLVFDLDADHLPNVTLGEDSYAEMLATCKDALLRLLDFLEDDFAFEEMEIVFSGGRGYHVHVRDDDIRHLEREHRREIVDYVRGIGLDFEELIETETVAGIGRKTPTERRTLQIEGGWGRRTHDHFMAFVDGLLEMDEADALDRLQEFDGIGEGKAQATLNAARNNREGLEAGNVTVHTAVAQLAERFASKAVERDNAPIDEPVTTDTNRLIRLPGSLHGGSGLKTVRLERDELGDFDPLVDAVPETFEGQEITVDVTDGGEVELGGDSFTVPEGDQSLPEHVAVFLMTRGRAEKEKE